MRRILAVCFGLLLLASAGHAGTSLIVQSAPGDPVGIGQTLSFTDLDGTFTATRNFDNGVSVNFDGGGGWDLEFAAAGDVDLTVATFAGATEWPFQDASDHGMDVEGQGRSCGSLVGSFEVLEITYGAGSAVDTFAADFVQYCDGLPYPLVGAIRINADAAVPPIMDFDLDGWGDIGDNCPTLANPDQRDSDLDGLGNDCDPCLDATFIEFDSDEGDYIGQGEHQVFHVENTQIVVSRNFNNGISFDLDVDNGDWWSVEFAAPLAAQITPGLYENATRFPFQGTGAGLSVSGSGRGCNELTGQFEVFEVEYDVDGNVVVFSANFEQHCEGGPEALDGVVRWRARFRPRNGDIDGDGWPKAQDNRPGTPNPTQAQSDGTVCLLTKEQQKCVNEMNKRGAALIKLQGRANVSCLKNAAKGAVDKLGTPATAQDCLTNDVAGKLAKGATKLTAKEAKVCGGLIDPPAFALMGSSAVSAAAFAETVALMGDVFGADLSAAVVDAAVDSLGAKCQQDVAKRMQGVLDGLCKEAVKGKKLVLKAKEDPAPTDVDELAAGIGAWMAGAGQPKVDKKVTALLTGAQSRCAGVDLAATFPGCNPVDAAELAACAERAARCRFCRALNAFDGMTMDCDVEDDAQLNASCP